MLCSYHADQPHELNQFTLWLLERHYMLPHCLLLIPELLKKDVHIRQRLEAIHKAGCLARFVIDEADKFLDVSVQCCGFTINLT